MADAPVLSAAVGAYPHTAALRDGRVRSDRLTLAFTDFAVISRAFAPMVREARFDVSEMAIATFLQARAADRPLVLLPVTLAARFQEPALLTLADGGVAGPEDLAGKRVGVRAYSQTTGMWLRGILAESHGVRPEQIAWVTFEDAHVPEAHDPAWCERAPAGSDMLAMLKDGTLDAVIVGNDVPNDPALRTVFADPAAASEAFRARYGMVPVNHMLCVGRDLAERHPELLAELVRMFAAAARAAGSRLPFGRAGLGPAIELALRFSSEQGLLTRPLDLADVWAGLPDDVA